MVDAVDARDQRMALGQRLVPSTAEEADLRLGMGGLERKTEVASTRSPRWAVLATRIRRGVRDAAGPPVDGSGRIGTGSASAASQVRR
jgi:hypothetical protein